MESLQHSMNKYRQQLEKGFVQKAYRGLMKYMMNLKTDLQKRHPDFIVPGNFYFGYMDMTYFAFFPKSLKDRKLKVGIIFQHESFKFEVWLFGINKKIQADYWNTIKESGWNKYHLVPSIEPGVDSILEHTLVENPDFDDLDALTEQIENGTLTFIDDIERYLQELESSNK